MRVSRFVVALPSMVMLLSARQSRDGPEIGPPAVAARAFCPREPRRGARANVKRILPCDPAQSEHGKILAPEYAAVKKSLADSSSERRRVSPAAYTRRSTRRRPRDRT